jgi:hypothetical protein
MKADRHADDPTNDRSDDVGQRHPADGSPDDERDPQHSSSPIVIESV